MTRRSWSSPRSLVLASLLGCSTALLVAPDSADAFCGFYVAGADAKLFNDATVVVLMRDGTRTVLSMQNAYQGPPEDFALVIPVPVVLKEGDVKTLGNDIFDRIDKLAAPRLVEYWEVDPCAEDVWGGLGMIGTGKGGGGTGDVLGLGGGAMPKVKVEAQFDVEEYEIVILSAKDSTGLDGWLRDNGYKIPEGAEPLLRPYVQDGMKFFVAKVDPTKVKFAGNGRAVLSPLRFHYDSKEFALPIRLGLINAPDPSSGGKQDLLVHILAPKTRYQAANYPNVTIPTNLDLQPSGKDRFGEFYVSLFDHTLAQTPKAVVTEYAWSAASCDPCPGDPLSSKELLELGADVLPRWKDKLADGGDREFVLTRLHARYDAGSLGEDLVFEAAPAIVGGREWPTDEQGNREQGAKPAHDEQNSFQARYAIRYPWTGKIECEKPQRNRWGGPPEAQFGENKPTVARQLATVARGGSLGSFVTTSAGSQLGVTVLEAAPEPDPGPKSAPVQPPSDEAPKPADTKKAAAGGQGGGCTCSLDDSPSSPWIAMLGLLALLGIRRRGGARG